MASQSCGTLCIATTPAGSNSQNLGGKSEIDSGASKSRRSTHYSKSLLHRELQCEEPVTPHSREPSLTLFCFI